jgi:hypothetical protein
MEINVRLKCKNCSTFKNTYKTKSRHKHSENKNITFIQRHKLIYKAILKYDKLIKNENSSLPAVSQSTVDTLVSYSHIHLAKEFLKYIHPEPSKTATKKLKHFKSLGIDSMWAL